MDVLRWILVAGTGRQQGLNGPTALLAGAFGKALAEQGFGLVVGGWPGVDYLVAQGFARALEGTGRALSDYLIQVVAEQRPAVYPAHASYPDFRGGYIIPVATGAREWIEALKYADAVLLLGGEGGTRETFWYATQEQRPVFPIPATGGDAAAVFADCVERWELFPYQGFTQEAFRTALARPADDAGSARQLVLVVLELLQVQFTTRAETRPPLFISYAHEDREWLLKLRGALRPLEHRAQLAVWDDHRLRAGDLYQRDIEAAIAQAPVAILIVSDDFFASSFIQQYELPQILARMRAGACKVLWLLVGGTGWTTSPLHDILSLNDVELPLAALSPARQQDALIMLRKSVAAAIG